MGLTMATLTKKYKFVRIGWFNGHTFYKIVQL